MSKPRKLLKVVPDEMTYVEAIEWLFMASQLTRSLRTAVEYLGSPERTANRYDLGFTKVTRESS